MEVLRNSKVDGSVSYIYFGRESKDKENKNFSFKFDEPFDVELINLEK